MATSKTRKKVVRAKVGVPARSRGFKVEGESVTVRLDKDSHPEVFDLDRMIKSIRKTREKYKGKRKMRDFCEFLEETEKSLGIILANHLEDALRKYLR